MAHFSSTRIYIVSIVSIFTNLTSDTSDVRDLKRCCKLENQIFNGILVLFIFLFFFYYKRGDSNLELENNRENFSKGTCIKFSKAFSGQKSQIDLDKNPFKNCSYPFFFFSVPLLNVVLLLFKLSRTDLY